MIQRPILFSAPMVRALLDGSKTQTRRVVKLKPDDLATLVEKVPNKAACCTYGQVGDQLWVRETFMDMRGTGIEHDGKGNYCYRADVNDWGEESRKDYGLKWKPSIFMPRAASRITLEITGVRVERLQDISDSDCKAEGVQVENSYDFTFSHVDREHHHEILQGSYASLWESLNGDGSWELNPWVWVIEFKRMAA